MAEETFIAVSGGFDPVTVGHARMFFDASAFGKVIVLLNSDEWLQRKKGFVFMPFEQRKELLEAFRAVTCVLPAIDDDGSVCQSIENLKHVIKIFGNGGDRVLNNTPEVETCLKYDISSIFGLGGRKVQSSSKLVKEAIASISLKEGFVSKGV